MFGNPTVMPVKILWDYLVYWSITGFIFMQGRMCQQTMYLRNMSKLSKLGKLNHFMQAFFRQWHHATEHDQVRGLINISEMPIIREMNTRLLDDMSNSEFYGRFRGNLMQLETLCSEIVEHSGLEVACPFRRQTSSMVRANSFEQVFHPKLPAREPKLVGAAN